MSVDVIKEAIKYLDQFNLAVIFSITVEDGILKAVTANQKGIVIEYMWTGSFWV